VAGAITSARYVVGAKVKYEGMKAVTLTTDGACIGNPGPGGRAAILRYKEHCRELCGSELETTNNRMEMRAVIEGLSAIKEPCTVTVRTDSQYLSDGMTKWIFNWKARNWVHKIKGHGWQPIKNRDLWEEIDRLRQPHEVSWEWVRGHANDPDNIRCDYLANAGARSQPSSTTALQPRC
jgi:ribonuclease HI